MARAHPVHGAHPGTAGGAPLHRNRRVSPLAEDDTPVNTARNGTATFTGRAAATNVAGDGAAIFTNA